MGLKSKKVKESSFKRMSVRYQYSYLGFVGLPLICTLIKSWQLIFIWPIQPADWLKVAALALSGLGGCSSPYWPADWGRSCYCRSCSRRGCSLPSGPRTCTWSAFPSAWAARRSGSQAQPLQSRDQGKSMKGKGRHGKMRKKMQKYVPVQQLHI